MKSEQIPPGVPPEEGKKLFALMREEIDKGNPLAEKVVADVIRKERPAQKKPPRFQTGAGAMDAWQKKQEEKEEEHWHPVAK